MWVIVGFRLTHPFSGLCAEWRVSPAQRVLNYSSGAGLRVINQSKAPWGPCEAHQVHRCTGHKTGCLLITLGLVSPFLALGRLPPWGLPVCWLWGSLPGSLKEPGTREAEFVGTFEYAHSLEGETSFILKGTQFSPAPAPSLSVTYGYRHILCMVTDGPHMAAEENSGGQDPHWQYHYALFFSFKIASLGSQAGPNS